MFHQRRLFRHLDVLLLVVVALLITVGALMVYSSTRAALLAAGKDPLAKVKLQLVWLLIALGPLLLAALVDYEKIASLAIPILGVVMLMLVFVLVISRVLPEYGMTRGTGRWIDIGPIHLQPSELAKIAVILVLASFLAYREDEVDTLSLVSRSLLFVAVPAGLVFLQPDLGTTVTLFLIWLTMLFIAGAKLPHLGTYALAGVLLFAAAWNLGVIRDYQKSRLTVFLHPEEDPTDAGWQLRQSMIAIGSGGLFGEGRFKGKQTQLNFVPDQETDLIFTAVGEEQGFLGCVLVLGLFGGLLWRTLHIAAVSKDTVGRLIAVGIAALFATHIVVNVGMTIGLMPVKGMPLPFISYGGSNLVTNLVCIGLLENIAMRRHKIAF